ncbi:MAG TPA: RNA-binding protein [Rhizobiaceae bacterium]|nr:RNA-binding protein [Rhizobiaceae bacterium]
MDRTEQDEDEMNPRTCIVTRQAGEADELIRFVAGPEAKVVPDLKRRLPGRGVWVTARREMVETAVRKRLFARYLKENVEAAETLPGDVERLLEAAALAALSMARKAGLVVTGFTKVESAVRSGKAFLLLNASDAAADGVRKLGQAVYSLDEAAKPQMRAIFSSDQMDLALGGNNVVHAAALKGGAADTLLARIDQLVRYRGE